MCFEGSLQEAAKTSVPFTIDVCQHSATPKCPQQYPRGLTKPAIHTEILSENGVRYRHTERVAMFLLSSKYPMEEESNNLLWHGRQMSCTSV